MGPKKQNKKGDDSQQQQPQPKPPKQAPPKKPAGAWGKAPPPQQQQQQQVQQQQQPQQPQHQKPQQQQKPQPQQPKQAPPQKPAGAWGKAPPPQQQPQVQQPQVQQLQPQVQQLQPQVQQQAPTQELTTTTTTSTTTSDVLVGRTPRRDMTKDIDIKGIAEKPVKTNTIKAQPVSILTNFFPIVFKGERKLYQYHIDFDPEQFGRDFKFKLVREFLTVNNLITTKFDGDHLLFSATEINITSTIVQGVNILIRKVKTISHKEKESSQLFNILTKSFMKNMGYSIIGRDYYTSTSNQVISKHFLEVWKGYSTSIVPTESGAMLLCDLSSKVVRSQTVLGRMKKIGIEKKNICEVELINSIILTRYNNKTYRISGIAWDGPNSRLNHKMDDTITYLEYYKTHYPKEKITDMSQPLLITKVKRGGKEQTIYLVPELTFLTGLSDEMRRDRHLMTDLAKEANIEPAGRLNNLCNFVGSFEKSQTIAKELEAWGISYSQSQKIKGVVLKTPALVPNENKEALESIKWMFIVEKQVFDSVCKKNLDIFIRESKLPPPTVLHPVGLPRSPRDIRSTIYTDIMAQYIPNGFTFFLIIIPQNNAEVYRGIKLKSLCEFKVLTQCIFQHTFEKGKPVATKLKQQIVAKLGLSPWYLGTVFNGVPKKTMIIGIDVGHNSDMRGKSVVGFVATIDDKFSKFHSQSILQKTPGKEIIDTLKSATQRAMKKYFDTNDCLPELIIVYRDGVGDGMLDLINKTEISAMKEGIAATPSSWGKKPKLMYVIVKKNTNARFFTDDSGRANPPPGTLVDHTITRPGWYDFYLVSQIAFKGSINPTHYHVLCDEYGMAADLFQYFTFQMCHLYFNFDKSVRVPASCMYAHKLAFLIGRTVNTQDVSPELYDKLFFL